MTDLDVAERAGLDPLLNHRVVRAACNGISRQTLYVWVREGKFPAPLQVGGKLAWPASTVRRWLEQQKARAPRDTKAAA